MQAFDRRSRHKSRRVNPCNGPGRCHAQDRPEPFTAGKDTVPHRFVQTLGAYRCGGKPLFKRVIHLFALMPEIFLQIQHGAELIASLLKHKAKGSLPAAPGFSNHWKFPCLFFQWLELF
jgi:hypothetical protein